MTKATVESMRSIDVRRLKRDSMLVPNNHSRITWEGVSGKYSTAELNSGSNSINIRYSDRGQWITCQIKLNATPCNYGHTRTWFECPECESRVAIVYLDSHVACRKCHNLNYRSQHERIDNRLLRKMYKIQSQLKSHSKSPYTPPKRPKHMKGHKFNKLWLKHAVTRRKALKALEKVL